MEKMECPECGKVNAMVAVVDDTRRYACDRCGMVYYSPNSCLTGDDAQDQGGRGHQGG